MEYQFATHAIEQQFIVSIRDRIGPTEIPRFLEKAFPELFGRIRVAGIDPAGPPFVIYHDFSPDGIDAEVCLPVEQVIPATDRVQSRVLLPATVARTLHVGRYEAIGGAYAALTDWVASHGFEVVGPIRERYLSGPGDAAAPAEYQTEIEVPVIPQRVAAAV